MRTYILFVAFLSGIFFSSCKGEASNFEMAASQEADIPASTESHPIDNNNQSPKEKELVSTNLEIQRAKKIIKDGSITLEVRNIQESKELIDTIVKKINGYYEIDEFNQTDYNSNYNLKIRVAANNFERFTAQILDLNGKVKHKDINARDVTDEYVDTESRMNSSKSYLARYRQLLSKANSIKDIIELETKIQAIQMEIESYEGRLKVMNDQIAYSTLTINVTEKHEYFEEKAKEHFGIKILNSFKMGFDILLNMVLGIITIWPLILFLFLPLIYRKRILAWWNKSLK
jgi:hypothetical protein